MELVKSGGTIRCRRFAFNRNAGLSAGGFTGRLARLSGNLERRDAARTRRRDALAMQRRGVEIRPGVFF